jgi:hypothetical protein
VLAEHTYSNRAETANAIFRARATRAEAAE